MTLARCRCGKPLLITYVNPDGRALVYCAHCDRGCIRAACSHCSAYSEAAH